MKSVITRLLFIIIIFPFNGLLAADQPGPFFLQHYDNRNGLSNSAINHIYKDANDLLWIATWDGLNMYDGNAFQVFNYSKENDFKSIGSNVIQQITEDKRGNIWATTIEGVSRYERRTGKFYNYFYNQYQRSRVSEQEYALATDGSGAVFCLSQRNGLSWYDAIADSFKTSMPLDAQNRISKIFFDAANRLWALHTNGMISVFSRQGNGFTKIPFPQPFEKASDIFKAGDKLFYSTSDNRFFSINPSTLTGTLVMQLPHTLTSIVFYKDHYLMAWSNKGYSVYDDLFATDDFLKDITKQLQDIRITSLAPGSEDILWLGTDGNGIMKLYPRTKPFGLIATSDNGMASNRPVRAFCEVNGSLWVATKGSGIIAMSDFWAKKEPQPRLYINAPESLDNNSVYALTRGNDGLVYIGTDAKGIGVYDTRNKKFTKWNGVKGFDQYAEFGSVYAILQDDDQSLWLGTSGYGLVHLKINRDNNGALSLGFLERFTFTNGDTGPANDIIYALAKSGQQQLWIGCRYGGLSLLEKKTRRFKTFKAFTYNGSLSNNDVLSLFEDSRNRLWVGTSYGLNYLDTKDANLAAPQFKKFTTADGLPNNTVHAISEDASGQVWVSTNKGLAKINTADGKIFYYQQADGLQSNEFSDGAVWKDASGVLYFGGTYGFNHFLPQDIRRSAWQPKLLLSGLLMGGSDNGENGYTVLDEATQHQQSFSVSRKDNFFELDMKAISFLNTDKCEYAWFLEGYDKTWHSGGTRGKIIYSNILPGNYKLHIKWSNGEGLWSKDITLFTLEVKQYLWLRWYFLAIYALVFAALIYFFYRYRKNKQSIRHQLEMQQILREKDEAVHESRIGFFTNIAHELQTPLTLIMGSVERYVEKNVPSPAVKDKPYFLSLIHQQASRLTFLVHQLLEFRKGEAGFTKNEFRLFNVSELLQNLAEPFMPLSEQHQMEYEISIAPGINGWMDKDKVEKIIFNLLSNAFKHSDKNEQVLFSARENLAAGQLIITVVNSGSGLPDKELEHLFDQFYVAKPNNSDSDKFGTGIGLAFTRQLVNLLKGSIRAWSENDRVSFEVILPLAAGEGQVDSKSSSDEPSYLYKTITSYDEPLATISAIENNKQAIIQNLQGDERKSILVVEDDQHIRFLLRDILKDDYIIHEATDGLEALQLIEKIMPELVICDVMMPYMNGLEFCNRVKNAPATCHLPVILLSARGSADQHIEGYEVGADAYINKPFQSEHLKIRIRKLLEYRRRLVDVFKNDQSAIPLKDSDLPDDDKAFLTKLVKEIEEHLAEPELSAVLLEKNFNMSKMQLYRKLKTMTGMTPGEFIRHIRLRHAAGLLAGTTLSVTEIFYRTGFNNQSYFYREFKKSYACSPNEYREKQSVQ